MKERAQSAIKIETYRLVSGPVEMDFELTPEELGMQEDPEYTFEAPIIGKFRATTAGGETVLVTARYSTVAKAVCARCAEEIQIPVTVENRFAWFIDPGKEEREREDDPEKLYYQGDTIDPVDAFREELLVALPFLPKCTPEMNTECASKGTEEKAVWTFGANGNPEDENANQRNPQTEAWISQLQEVKTKLSQKNTKK